MMASTFTPHAALSLLGQDSVTVTTDKRRSVTVRRGGSADSELVWDMHCRLSERTIHLRYGAPKQLFPEAKLRGDMARMLDDDPQLGTTLIGTVDENGARRAVSLVQLVHAPDDQSVAEVAIVVRDDYQREGLGRALGRLLGPVAQARGVRSLRLYTLAENQAIVRLVKGFGIPYWSETRYGETTIVIPITTP
jgi:GNAT superfamily N-acetyltransferase